MKKLRNSFTLLVALATIGITLMSNKVITSPAKNTFTQRCYKAEITVNDDFCELAPTIHSFMGCYQAGSLTGSHVFDLDPSNYVEAADIDAECGLGFEIFCCAQVTNEFQYCPEQPYLNLEGFYGYYRIDRVYCKYND